MARGVPLDMLRVRGFPFHHDVSDFIADHDFVFVVEQNRDSQLRTLITNECGIDPARLVSIVHYDGTPITARFIANAIGDRLDAMKVTPLRKVMSERKMAAVSGISSRYLRPRRRISSEAGLSGRQTRMSPPTVRKGRLELAVCHHSTVCWDTRKGW